MRLELETAILSQYQRLPGFHSEFVGLDILRRNDETIGFEDILNGSLPISFILPICFRSDPRDSFVAPPSLHEVMEHRLGLTSNNENSRVHTGVLRGLI